MLLGSMVVGGVCALVGAYLTRRLLFLKLSGAVRREETPHMELALVTTVALFTYAAAERLDCSGIMALFVCGVATRHYTYHNLSHEAQESTSSFFLTLASLAETSLATLLGVAAFDYLSLACRERNVTIDATLALATLPVLMLTRALNIFPLSLLANGCRPAKKRIDVPMQVRSLPPSLTFARPL